MRSALPIALACAACAPAFETPPWKVDGVRILAVRAEPPEAAPGTTVALDALVVAPDGGVAVERRSWALCLRQRAVAASGAVAQECLEKEAPWIEALGSGEPKAAKLPLTGCALFGPEPPPGEVALRPQDPDQTGGYFQPVRLTLDEGLPVAFARVRLGCALPQAPAAIAREYRDRYRPNRNPRGLSLQAGVATVRAGQRLTLTATWDAGSREPYLVYALATAALEDRAEALRLDWFTTGGELAEATVAPGEAASATVSWLAPATRGRVGWWAVLRDDRGGVAWAAAEVEVE